MKVKAINVEIQRAKGSPLFYSLNPLTLGPDQFALLAGLAEGYVAFDNLQQRYKLKKALAAKRIAEAVQN